MKKHAKETSYKNYNKMLEDRTKDFNLEAEKGPPNVNARLNTKDKDNTLLYEGQLEETRTGSRLVITDKALDTEEKLYLDKRNNMWDTDVQCVDKASEAENQKYLKDYKDAESKQTFDTSFWDEYVGVQMEGETTKVKVNTQKSQLQNKAERFDDLNKENIQDVASYKKNKAMVFASLKDADALLFQVYAKVFSEGRKISETEKQIITDINAGKARIFKKNQTLTTPIYEKQDRTHISHEGNQFVVYDGNGKEIWRAQSEQEALREFPDALREY